MKLLISVGGVVREFQPNPDLGVITIGRAQGNDLPLPDEKGASRRHLTLERLREGDKDTWKLVDQMSANGTELNGEKVNFAYVKEGDVIGIGRTRIQVTGLLAVPPQVVVPQPAAAKPAPAAAQPAGRAPVLPAGRRAPVVTTARRRNPAAVALVAAAALVFAAVSAYLVLGNQGVPEGPEYQRARVDQAADAELSQGEKDLIARAQGIAGEETPLVDRLAALDELEAGIKNRRGSVVIGNINRLRDGMLLKLLDEVRERSGSELSAVNAELEDGNFRAALPRLEQLNQWLQSSPYIRKLAREAVSQAQSLLNEGRGRNERFYNGALGQAADLASEGRFDDAIELIDMVLERALLSESDAALCRVEKARLYERKAVSEVETVRPVEVPRAPSILDKIKESNERVPGANALLPQGEASERALLDALHVRMAAAAAEGRLTSNEFTYRGARAIIKGATPERVSLDVAGRDKRTGEELPYAVRIKWTDINPEDMLQLYDRTPLLTSEDYLATVIYAFNHGFVDLASSRALVLYKRENAWKDGIDTLIAAKRRITIPEGGFIEFEGALVAPNERESLLFQRKLREVLARFEKNAGHKDRRKREEAEAAFSEIVAMGEAAVAPAIAILDRMRQAEMQRAEQATGLLAKDDGKLRELLAELDKRRAHALELIMDTVRYPYPYGPDGNAAVNADVAQRVAAVREIWNDPTAFVGQTNPDYEAAIDRVRAVCEKMAILDPQQQYYTGTPDEDIEYIRTIANDKLSIRNYAPAGDTQRKSLISLNRQIMEINEKFPTGPRHTDAEGREQVRITNEYRIMFGRVALKLNDKLFWAAKLHSRWCVEQNRGVISHDSPGGPRGNTPAERMRHEGYGGGGGENIHMNSQGPTPLSSHQGWCGSSGHHRNILNPMWRVLGSGKWQTIWTQNFGSADELDGNSESRGGE